MSLKCFLCTKEFEGSGSMTDLSSSQISFLFQVFHISPDDTEKHLLRLKFQNVCYCSECFEIISNLSSLAEELEILEAKVSTEKRNIVDRLRQSTAKFSEKVNGPPGMLQMLRTEIISDIDKVCARKRVRSKDFSSTSEMKKQNRPRSKSTQTDHVYDHNRDNNSCRQISQDSSCDNESDCANSYNRPIADPIGTRYSTNLMTPPKNGMDQILDDNPEDDSGTNGGSMSVLNMNIISLKNEKNLAEIDSTLVADPLGDAVETNLDMGIVQDNMETSEKIQNKSYTCGTCDEVFDEYSVLKVHDSAHHNIKSKTNEYPVNEEEMGVLESNDSLDIPKKKHNCIRSKSTKTGVIHGRDSHRENRQLRNRASTERVSESSPGCADSRSLVDDAVVETEDDDKDKIRIRDGKSKKVKRENDKSAGCEPPTKPTSHKKRNKNDATARKRVRVRATTYYQPKKCEECGKILSNLGTWRAHILTIHQQNGKYKCKLCDYSCQYPGNLKSHVSSRHSDVRKFVCDVCKKTFNRMCNLKAHQTIHEGDTPYECELCLAKFKYAASLSAHKVEGHCKQIKVKSPLVKRVRVPRDGKSVRRKKSHNP